jgi:hypothetical protein
MRGRYIIPARAVEEMLSTAHEHGGTVNTAEWRPSWDQGRRD